MSGLSKRQATEYLRELKEVAPERTFRSHQTVIRAFDDWYSDGRTPTGVGEACAAEYIADKSTTSDYSQTTLRGEVTTLSNFISYVNKRNPRLVQEDILERLNRQTSSIEESRPGANLSGDSGNQSHACEKLLSYLRKCRYGCRSHAFAELLYDTKSKPGPLLDTNVQDIDVANCTVELTLPQTHVVSKTGIVTEWTASFSADTAAVLEEYLEYERSEVAELEEDPLFTTAHGRIDASTMRRDIRRASRMATDSDSLDGSSRHQSNITVQTATAKRSLTPCDVWECAIQAYKSQA